MSDINTWRAKCDPACLPAIDALREIAAEAGPDLIESIKWNGPTFAQNGEDRLTLGIDRKGGVRAVLHRGAAKSSGDFDFDDPDGLAKWPSPDRGVMTFKHVDAVEGRRPELARLFARWLDATR